MHELGMATDLWNIALKAAEQNKLAKINRIKISVGENSGIDKSFLKHSFVDHIFPGTIAEDAKLEFLTEKVKIQCPKCKMEHNPDSTLLNCSNCGNLNTEITAGKDVRIIEVEGE